MQIEMTKSRWGLLVIVVLVGALVIYASWPKLPKPIDTQQILNEALETMKKPLLAEIEAQKKQVADYKSRLVVSEAKYKVLTQKYNDLQKEKENVKPPETNAELRDRFTALGYSPLPIK